MTRPSTDEWIDNVTNQRLWLSLQRRAWRSLAIVAASDGVETVSIAHSLAKIAWWYTGQPCIVFDMRDLSLRLLDQQLREIVSRVGAAERVFVALRAATSAPTTTPIARATDAAVLCISLGSTAQSSAAQALEAIGRDKFIGSLLVSDSSRAAPLAF